MAIQNGDLVWRRTDASPLASHYGIAVHRPDGLHVMHRQRHNGGVVQPMQTFLLGHPLRGSRSTRLTGQSTETLLERFERTSSGRFDIIANNCEQWAYRYIGELPTFTQTDLRMLAGIIAIVATIYIISR